MKKTFYANPSVAKINKGLFWFCLCGLLAALYLAIMVDPSFNGFIGAFLMGGLIGSLGFYQSRRPLVQIESDFLEVKLGPLAALRLVNLTDVQGITQKKRLCVVNLKQGKAIKIPLGNFARDDQTELVKSLTQAINTTSGSAA